MRSPTTRTHYDVVIAGGGHNGLVAAGYLSGAGLYVLVLERGRRPGGAAVSTHLFPGVKASLSPYAYLVSMLPRKIVSDLDLNFEARKRRIASYTPYVRNGRDDGLIVSNEFEAITRESFLRLARDPAEYAGHLKLRDLARTMARHLWPSLLEPMPTRAEMKNRFRGKERLAWDLLVERPLGVAIERYLKHDLSRGLAFTDGTIGTLTHPHDPSLVQNRTFLFHVIGNGTGEWCVPVGGMGRLTEELVHRAVKNRAEILTGADVTGIEPGKGRAAVKFTHRDREWAVDARFALANLAPQVLAEILPGYEFPDDPGHEGSFVKINVLLRRLPRLRAGCDPADAFTGTFHLDEGYANIYESYETASRGGLPQNPPGEMYCHTLTDDSILSPELASAGCHSLTLFGLEVPYGLFTKDNEKAKDEVWRRYLRGLNRHLAEPMEECLARDENGRPCIEIKSPLDIERELAMPRGNIFHKRLSWPFAEAEEERSTWGVEIGFENIFLCGSGAMRGGCVSGIPGHNAARKVLEVLNGS